MKNRSWSSLASKIESLPQNDLAALIKDLYDLSSDNRDFVTARILASGNAAGSIVLDGYRERVEKAFYPMRGGFRRPKLTDGRKAISDYRKAVGDNAGLAELMITYVESGVRFTNEFGEIDEGFYNSIEAVMENLCKLLLAEGKELYFRLEERIRSLRDDTSHIGWGFGDYMADQVAMLENNFAK